MKAFSISVGRIARLLCAVLLLPCLLARAETRDFEFDEMVVTGSAAGETLWLAPRGATLITREEIERSGTTSLVELLSREAGIQPRSFTGNDKAAGLDLRGMGDTFSSNVLVLVDGVRLNAPDLSGADLGSIDLAAVERIEIVRGAGSVRYGDGAVGGVINIVTRSPDRDTAAQMEYRRGSFDSESLHLRGSLAAGDVTLNASIGGQRSDGYRRNSFLRARDASLVLDFRGSWLRLGFQTRFHDDHYGLPGPVSLAQYQTEAGRRSSSSPHDEGETLDRRHRLWLELDGGPLGELVSSLALRNRDNPFVLGYDITRPKNDQVGGVHEVSRDLQLGWRHEGALYGIGHRLELGWNGFLSDYRATRNGLAVPDQSTETAGNVLRRGLYATLRLDPLPWLRLSGGWRDESFRLDRTQRAYRRHNRFVLIGGIPVLVGFTDSWDLAGKDLQHWNNSAGEIGIVLHPGRTWSLFLSRADSFRAPNIDELALSTPDLRPQQGEHWEAGLRWQQGATLEAALTLFRLRVEEEIGFDGTVNRNFDEPTRRLGGELELKFYPLDSLYLWFNAGYVDARFERSEARVPLVARTSASGGLRWQPAQGLSLRLAVRHVGSRHDGNDLQNGRYPKLPPYTVLDLGLAVEQAHWRLAAGINNALDEVYSTSAYSQTFYPMPGRNLYTSLRLTL